MIRGIIIAVLGVAIAATGYWGYKEHQEKDAVLLHAENNYQRAFHELTYHVDQLHDKIGTTLAMNSKKSLSPALIDVWRITSEAHNNVSQLPLTLMPFNKTEEFLSNIGDFSYKTSVRDLDQKPLDKKEYTTLNSLYKQAENIQNQLRSVQHLVMSKNLRWMDVEMALASDKKQSDNTIVDSFKTVEKNVGAFSEDSISPTFTGANTERKGFTHLKGKQITEKEAIKIAQRFAPDHNYSIKLVKSGRKTNRDVYSIRMNDADHKSFIYMDITQKGGHPVYLIQKRAVKKQKISLNEASNRAVAFLKKNGYETKGLEIDESAQYNNIGVFSFIPVEKNVRIYPEAIRMKVALDDGEVVGFSARDYLAAHRTRTIPAPALSADEAKAKLNKNVEVRETRQALITNELGQEVLCYEMLGTIGKDTYQMFINADDGKEEKIEKLKSAEPIYKDL
ncbi:germination protein YpeB [Bacillus amyloliquefaciens]|uniref:germination protein YpeB n=1 Tax=Bacillus amyloliquefaciens group TaxID=1938374 RepID=UPI000470E7AD|nr:MULTISPECIES: germination protein YpeB [Bacillus amyloliquefaciens group]APB82661.1 germination protein YpeB [Bacillus amyloliquefaciens]AWM83536.1 germination protein YpeB [Bacillus velezensis]KDN93805.1 sporulation protein [Bacillus amyloliquefaciens]PAE32607.1 germination protein YpeB [Bacillus velezensis]UQB56411.1 germination protein YpeB [Bacillus velezensis]